MNRFPLELLRSPRINSCSFETRAPKDFEGDEPIAECGYAIGLNYVKDENIINVRLGVSMDDEHFPFSFDVTSELRLAAPEGAGEEDNKLTAEAQERAILSGCPYLYSYLGDFVAELTRKGCGTPFYIPYLDMEEASRQKLSED